MNWYPSIADAVSTAKKEHAVFVVFIEGADEASITTLRVINKKHVSDQLSSKSFVSIKLTKDSEGHKQFMEIYKLVPVPSVFFIAQNGQPFEIIVGTADEAEVETKILNAIQQSASHVKGGNAVENSQSQPAEPVQAPQSPAPTVEKPVASTSERMDEGPSTSASVDSATGTSVEDRVAKAKQLLIQKNLEKKLLEQEKEKEEELERRKLGQRMQEVKMKKMELELKELIDEREKTKREEAAAKKRVLDQIAQDRAERRERSSALTAPPQHAPVQPSPPPAALNENIARLQFKIPTGEIKTHSFPADTTLAQVRQFIDNNIVLPFNEYQMATTYPRRDFTHRDNNLDLRTLHLLPSAVILILPVHGLSVTPHNPGVVGAVTSFLWTFVTPLVAVANYVRSFLFGTPPPQAPASPAAPRSTAPRRPHMREQVVRKRGNIHTLRDADDSSDENNTWNGNSTQQM